MDTNTQDMQRILDAQKKHFIKEGAPSIELRVDRLNRLKNLIMENRYDFVDALNAYRRNDANPLATHLPRANNLFPMLCDILDPSLR